jgi:SHS2 domain-containing protein
MPERGHELLPHTADAGIRAWAPTLPALFEEAAAALGSLSADVPPGVRPDREEDIELDADDLEALAFSWLNELIGLIDVHGALVGARVGGIEQARTSGTWGLRAEARFVRVDGMDVRRRDDIKSATYHGLAVAPVAGAGWSLTAYLDL